MEQKLTNTVLPSVFAESVFQLDGQPFRLKDRRYLIPIYDSRIEDGMIMSGRQVEKSTTNSVSMATRTLLLPFFKALYFAPLTSQVREFSRERIGKVYDFSQEQIVKKNYIRPSDSQAVQFKEFSNGSVNYFKHCFGLGDNIRGITVNGIWGDEIQDIHIDAIPVIEECQSHALDAGARMRIKWYTGTPKTFSNTIQQRWDRSTQNEWVVRCQGCGLYQIMGVKNLTPKNFVCRKCDKELTRDIVANGFWYALQKGKYTHGFRISQMMVPWINPEDIWRKYTEYEAYRFYNEVLGRSYENAEKPFTSLILAQISNNDLKLYTRLADEFSNRPTFMGTDWGTGGTSKTVTVIYGYNKDGKFQKIFTKIYETGKDLDPEYQLKDICHHMTNFKVKYHLVDWGFGYTQYKKLRSLFGSRVAACYYSFNQRQKTKFDRHESRWIVNRTAVMQDYITAVHEMKVIWPGADKSQFTFAYDHHLAEMAEYRKAYSGRSEDLMYTHPEGQPDDALHAGVLAYLASKLSSSAGGAGHIEFASAHGERI